MQECHDNNKIESHDHNEYPLLYKEAEILLSSLGSYDTSTRTLPDIYALALRHCAYIHIYIYIYISDKALLPVL